MCGVAARRITIRPAVSRGTIPTADVAAMALANRAWAWRITM